MTYSELILSHSPSNYWKLNESTGLVAADSAGSAPGTISGGVTLGQASGLADGTTAMLFNGSTGKITTAAVTLPVICTIEGWVKTASPLPVVSSRGLGGTGDLLVATVTGVAMYIESGAAFVNGPLVPADVWTHVVYVLNGTTAVLYLNGVSISGAFARTTPSVGPCTLGWDTGTTAGTGALDEVAIYPRALTPTEISDHYAARLLTAVPSAGCDHTTVWSKHLATLSAPTVESERAYLANLYGEPGGTDFSTLVSRWLQEITCGTAVATPAAPTLSTVSPNTGTQGTMVTVTLTGTGFIANATGVSVNGLGISVVNIHVLSPTSLTADLAIDAAAPPTARSITVSTAGGSSSQAFTVTAAPTGGGGSLALLGDRQYTAPAAASSIALTPSGSAWTNSAYVTVLASAPAAAVLTGVILQTADGTSNSVSTDVEIDIATGAASAEVVIATVRAYNRQIFNGSLGPSTCVLPIPIDAIPTGARLSARMRQNTGNVTPWTVAVTYLLKPLTGTPLTTAQPQKTLPPAATGITVTTGGTAWVNGAWAQLRAATGPALVITGVVFGAPSQSAAYQEYELDLGTGGAGLETVLTTLHVHTSNEGIPAWRMLPTPLDNVAVGVRLAARLRSNFAGAATMIISLMVVEPPL